MTTYTGFIGDTRHGIEVEDPAHLVWLGPTLCGRSVTKAIPVPFSGKIKGSCKTCTRIWRQGREDGRG